ncbi:hypothetical protein PG984_011573 [Apiospora sp. TS-2023a]
MHLTFIVVAALTPISVLSAPAPAPLADLISPAPAIVDPNAGGAPNHVMGARQTTTQWTMRNVQRPCAQGNNYCVWNFDIDTGTPPTQHCSFKTPGPFASFGGVKCGAFRIGVGYNSEGHFTVLSVVEAGLIIYPGYTDQQLKGSHVVTPDQSYTPRPALS